MFQNYFSGCNIRCQKQDNNKIYSLDNNINIFDCNHCSQLDIFYNFFFAQIDEYCIPYANSVHFSNRSRI